MDLQSPLRLLGMALSCAGLHLVPVCILTAGLLGGQLQLQGLLFEKEEPTAAESLSQWSHPHDTESRSFQRVFQCH
jgi:hypothetical protein